MFYILEEKLQLVVYCLSIVCDIETEQNDMCRNSKGLPEVVTVAKGHT